MHSKVRILRKYIKLCAVKQLLVDESYRYTQVNPGRFQDEPSKPQAFKTSSFPIFDEGFRFLGARQNYPTPFSDV